MSEASQHADNEGMNPMWEFQPGLTKMKWRGGGCRPLESCHTANAVDTIVNLTGPIRIPSRTTGSGVVRDR